MKLADLTSGIGALTLGVGLGALIASWLGRDALAVAIVGAVLHAFGMWDKHRLEARGEGAHPIWIRTMYWLCWILLAVGAVYLALVRPERITWRV
jgi:hypothetical protein